MKKSDIFRVCLFAVVISLAVSDFAKEVKIKKIENSPNKICKMINGEMKCIEKNKYGIKNINDEMNSKPL